MCVCMYMYVCVHVSMYVCVCAYVRTYVCIYVRMYVCMHTCVCVFVCKCTDHWSKFRSCGEEYGRGWGLGYSRRGRGGEGLGHGCTCGAGRGWRKGNGDVWVWTIVRQILPRRDGIGPRLLLRIVYAILVAEERRELLDEPRDREGGRKGGGGRRGSDQPTICTDWARSHSLIDRLRCALAWGLRVLLLMCHGACQIVHVRSSTSAIL